MRISCKNIVRFLQFFELNKLKIQFFDLNELKNMQVAAKTQTTSIQ